MDPVQVVAKFSGVAAEIRKRVDEFGNELKSCMSDPAEVTVEFGVELEAEAGLPVIVKGTANCHVTVSATWRIKE
ncbi:CU044_2847 family protein [Kocuria rosea]|nr:CU044_2847 family protein [Kocuria rosea]QCY31752.1 hypothetical protein EQG70_01805 [Kocuria rosea]